MSKELEPDWTRPRKEGQGEPIRGCGREGVSRLHSACLCGGAGSVPLEARLMPFDSTVKTSGRRKMAAPVRN